MLDTDLVHKLKKLKNQYSEYDRVPSLPTLHPTQKLQFIEDVAPYRALESAVTFSKLQVPHLSKSQLWDFTFKVVYVQILNASDTTTPV